MKRIKFSDHILPHLIAVGVFLIVTFLFFKPVFFENKKLQQADIQEWEGSSKALRDYRVETGEEGLWTPAMFSGMPAYLINVSWGNKAVTYVKAIMSLSLPHPIANIFLAFVCYYILLLSFGVRPYLAMAGAIAFGLSTYMIIGLSAGHNARIGAIAFMPLVMAGVHLVFSDKKILGFGITTTGFALHLRENHLQMTYYLAIIIVAYGIVQLIYHYKQKSVVLWIKNVGMLVPAVVIAIGTFFGPLWAITEYSAYTIRGKSDLVSAPGNEVQSKDGLGKRYAFEFSNGILEPMTLLIPNFYGGASSNFLFQDEKSETFKALMNSGDQETANRLINNSSAYWGPQRLAAPYYAGAIIIFLFGLGIAFADKTMVWWLVPLTVLSIMLSWGENFEAFNYFIFDYFPGYNKFRSVTFTLVIALFSMPLLAMIGLEKIMTEGMSKEGKKNLLIAAGITGGLCLLAMLLSGMLSFTRDSESQLPSWFVSALAEDRQGLLTSDAFRSLAFIGSVFVLIYFEIYKKITPLAFYAFIILMITLDLAVVNKRYLTEQNFNRSRESARFVMTEADEEIRKDKSYYRVFNMSGPSIASAWKEARTSYFHNSIGGYHGAKLRRYQDLLDSCLYSETVKFYRDGQSGAFNFSEYGILNMLNTKYIVFGAQRNAVLRNPAANGNAWFVHRILEVKSPTEELKQVCDINTRTTAVVDASAFNIAKPDAIDSSATIKLLDQKPNYLKYESTSSEDGLAVFSEIYYEKGWKAFIDNVETDIVRANYVLRALPVKKGNHTIEFKFEPASYHIGNPITLASSWLMVIVLVGSVGMSLRSRLKLKV